MQILVRLFQETPICALSDHSHDLRICSLAEEADGAVRPPSNHAHAPPIRAVLQHVQDLVPAKQKRPLKSWPTLYFKYFLAFTVGMQLSFEPAWGHVHGHMKERRRTAFRVQPYIRPKNALKLTPGLRSI